MPDVVRAASYTRVSTERQAQSDRNSLDVQRDAFHARCRKLGYTPAGEFQDVASGRRDARPAYQRMLRAAKEGAFKAIVVTYLDRFGRRDEEIALRVLELKTLGVEIDVINEKTEDFISLALSARKADQESRRIGERTKQGMEGSGSARRDFARVFSR